MTRKLHLKSVTTSFAAIAISMILSSPLFGQAKTQITLKCDPPAKQKTSEDGKAGKKTDARSKGSGPQFEPEKQLIKTGSDDSLTGTTTLAIGCTGGAFVTVLPPGGPPNQTVIFTVSQTTTPQILGLRWNSNDAFTPTLQVPVQLNSSGLGQSAVFQVKAQLAGTTLLTSYHPSYTPDDHQVIVVECLCPNIVSSPPIRTP